MNSCSLNGPSHRQYLLNKARQHRRHRKLCISQPLDKIIWIMAHGSKCSEHTRVAGGRNFLWNSTKSLKLFRFCSPCEHVYIFMNGPLKLNQSLMLQHEVNWNMKRLIFVGSINFFFSRNEHTKSCSTLLEKLIEKLFSFLLRYRDLLIHQDFDLHCKGNKAIISMPLRSFVNQLSVTDFIRYKYNRCQQIDQDFWGNGEKRTRNFIK